MDKKALIKEEIRIDDIAIAGVIEDIEKYEILGNENMVEYKKKSLELLTEDRDKYTKMLEEMEEI